MPLGNWRSNFAGRVGLVALATLLTGLAFFSLPNNKFQQSDHAKAAKSGAQQHSEYTLRGVKKARVPVVARQQPPPSDPPADRKEWREEQDLEAQWKQAEWAKYAVFAAIASVLVTGFGIWFVRQTLEATRASIKITAQAAAASAKQADAALEGNRLAQLAYAADQRPWLTFAGISLASGVTYEQGAAHIMIQFNLQNSGRTPAIHVDLRTHIYSVGTHRNVNPFAEQPKFVDECRANKAKAGYLIAPGRTAGQRITMSVNAEEIAAIRAGDLKWLLPYVIGCITYRSTFADDVYVTAETVQISKAPNLGLPLEGPEVPMSDLVLITMPFGSGYAT